MHMVVHKRFYCNSNNKGYEASAGLHLPISLNKIQK